MGEPEIGIIGLGSVGWAVMNGLGRFYECIGYDIEGYYRWEDILKTKIIFICVATPENDKHRLECENITEILNKLNSTHFQGLIIIKSTLKVGFMNETVRKFPKLRLIYMPEFLREKNSFTWFLNTDRIVISGKNNADIEEALSYFSWVKGIPILIMDFINAEIGKLAHNAFIATKVSFTNEIERICKEQNADPEQVMSVIWADRRVKSNEHLKPNLGPYGGKCVPKDVRELIGASEDAKLLKAVENINNEINKVNLKENFKVCVLIPTLIRLKQLKRALDSIKNQSLKPDLVLIIPDVQDEGLSRLINDYQALMKISIIPNQMSKNLSGAINTGLIYLILKKYDSNSTYIALLDDDDWWDKRYLENNLKYAIETSSDWIISGLIRYEDGLATGNFLNIPKILSKDDFLTGNPNVQGSNLFVRLSKLIEINGFDETLNSTTDRDTCIRLLGLNNINYVILYNHLVHHHASNDPTRLSFPGSEKKRQGLVSFFKKYKNQMNSDQILKFKERSKNFFNIIIE